MSTICYCQKSNLNNFVRGIFKRKFLSFQLVGKLFMCLVMIFSTRTNWLQIFLSFFFLGNKHPPLFSSPYLALLASLVPWKDWKLTSEQKQTGQTSNTQPMWILEVIRVVWVHLVLIVLESLGSLEAGKYLNLAI